MEPRNRFQGMNSASLCSLAGRYDNPIHTRFLATIRLFKNSSSDLNVSLRPWVYVHQWMTWMYFLVYLYKVMLEYPCFVSCHYFAKHLTHINWPNLTFYMIFLNNHKIYHKTFFSIVLWVEATLYFSTVQGSLF
jgi:hypothetical protein